MIVLVTGAHGMLGQDLAPLLAAAGHEVLAPTHQEVALEDKGALEAWLAGRVPRRVYHLAAYTDVDGCEKDPERVQTAEEVLSANIERAGTRLIMLVTAEQRRFMSKPSYEQVVELKEFNPSRATDKTVTADRLGPFVKTLAYEGWARSMFPVVWFDTQSNRGEVWVAAAVPWERVASDGSLVFHSVGHVRRNRE